MQFMDWLRSIVYGFVFGLSQFLPISSEAHGALVLRVFGSQSTSGLLSLLTRVGCLIALLICCRKPFSRLRRDRRRARRSKGGVDRSAIFLTRLLRTAVVPLVLCWLFYGQASALSSRLNLLALFLLINGVVLFLPRLFSSGNKDARSVSSLDGVLLGLGAGASVVPGISPMGMVLSLGSLRGLSRSFSLNFAFLLSIPVLLMGILFDILGLATGGLSAIDLSSLLQAVFAGIMGFLGSCCGISAMRFLAVRIGFSGFAYYCWGAALFTFILFVTI